MFSWVLVTQMNGSTHVSGVIWFNIKEHHVTSRQCIAGFTKKKKNRSVHMHKHTNNKQDRSAHNTIKFIFF